MSDKFYITTAIDYANGDPHIGHAFEKLGADCIARYRRLRGDRVSFCIGMDENAQNVVQAAEEEGVSPVEWVDRIADRFKETWDELSITYTDFIRTTEKRHEHTVQELLRRIREGGYLYEGTYSGYYCVGCEAFKLEKDLVDGQCPNHPTREIKWLEEPNHFFRLSAFRDELLDLFERQPDFVRPRPKLNEIRNVVKDGLQDLSVSRARLPWGIQWPDDPEHTIYVWFDALINYLSSTGFPDDGWEGLWPADLHVIGPDILRFHAAIWPAMLSAASLPLPASVWSHGWVKLAGGRFSKSAGVTLELREAIDRHGSDPLRYFLLREIPWDADGSFSWERFDARYAADLADGFGNLASRVLAMLVKYRNGTVPQSADRTELDGFGDDAVTRYREAMDNYLLHDGAAAAWDLVARANSFIEESAPWSLYKNDVRDRLDAVLAALARCLARISIMAAPFLPQKVESVWSALDLDGTCAAASWDTLLAPSMGGRTVSRIAPLFPKVPTT